MELINGREIAQKILEETKLGISKLDFRPKLVVILATNDESSHRYVTLKKSQAQNLGIEVEVLNYTEDVTLNQLATEIKNLNEDPTVTGILVQLPLFEHLQKDYLKVVNLVKPEKDVDGLTATQQGRVSQLLSEAILPATVDAVLECLKVVYTGETSQLPLTGKKLLILNNSILVGKPLALMLSSLNATVTIANKFTPDLTAACQNADIIITATGQTQILDASMIKDDAILIDVTSEKVGDKVLGDVISSEELYAKVSYLTPVPGGVGPITIACLLRNLLKMSQL